MSDFDQALKLLHTRNIQDRIKGAEILAELKDPRGTEILINNLPELHSELRYKVVYALGEIGDPAASGPLIVIFDETPSTFLRREIINSLLKIKDSHSMNKLMEIISSSNEDLYLRVSILKEIISFKLEDSAEVINKGIFLLKDSNLEIKKYALKLLMSYNVKNIENNIFPLVKEEDYELRVNSLKYLYQITGSRIVDKIVEILSLKTLSDAIKARIVEILGVIENSKIKDLLIKLVMCNIEEIRKSALISLSNYNDEETLNIFIRRLKDENPVIRKTAILCFARLGNKNNVKFVIPMIMDKEEIVRKEAVVCINSIININEIHKLEALLSNPNKNVRDGVIQIFAKNEYFPNGFFNNVKDFYDDSDDFIRKKLIDILCINPDKVSYDILLEVFDKSSENVKIAILYALKNYKSLYDELVEIIFEKYKLESSPKVRAVITDLIAAPNSVKSGTILIYIVKNENDSRTKSNAIEHLENYVEVLNEVELVNAILPALKDDNNRVKANAAKTLWKLGGLRMVAMLQDMLKSDEKWERASACFVLGEIGAFQVIPVLKEAVDDVEDVVRANAIKALAKCGESDFIEECMERYISQTDVVKKAIIFSVRFFNTHKSQEFLLNRLEEDALELSEEAAYSFNFVIKDDENIIDKLMEKIDKLSVNTLKIIVEGLQYVKNQKSLEILTRLSYYDDIELSAKALNYYKKVEKSC